MRTDHPAVPFLGAPIETDLSRLEADVAVLGVPHGSAYPDPGLTVGCAAAPTAIRDASQRLAAFRGHWDFDLDAALLPTDGIRLVDAGDVPGAPLDAERNTTAARAAVSAILDAGAVPICLGGDDSVPISILRGFEDRGPLVIVQVDAHLDFRDEVDGIRDGYSSAMRRASEMPHVTRIIQVGMRGVGSARPSDVLDARAAGNVLVTAAALAEDGMAAVMEHVDPSASVFISFDLDGVDPAAMPAVSGRSPGGLSARTAIELVTALGPRLVGGVITEYVPERDVGGVGALLACRIAVLMAAGVSSHRKAGVESTRI